jgi:cytochrome c oxidase subunit 3
MWIFLSSEALFFGGLFLSLLIYRFLYPHEMSEGTRHLNFYLATINTAVLLTSSWTMIQSVMATEEKERPFLWLNATALLGVLFLLIKGIEYRMDWQEGLVPIFHFDASKFSSPKVTIFFLLYFFMTGIHALHLLIGICLTLWLRKGLKQKKDSSLMALRTEVVGLYWHFVDIIWVFLYPLLYLIGRH